MSEIPGVLILSLIDGLGPVKIKNLIDVLGDPAGYSRREPAHIAEAAGVSTEEACRILRELDKPAAAAREIMEAVEKKGYRLYFYGQDSYPELLREIYDPPPVIYSAGEILPGDYNAVAVVGTRKASQYGRAASGRISGDVALAGLTVVSGCALGVDASAHRAALDSGGRTIGVLGSGLDRRYPAPNRGLMEEISARGALISELAPHEAPAPHNFPRRNRIISGLSLATIVAEAPERSGALITVGQALEQGRAVLAVPGSVFSEKSSGCNMLIKQGAVAACSATDVINEISCQVNMEFLKKRAAERLGEMPEFERKVLESLSEGITHIDLLSRRTGIPVCELTRQLTRLELKGRVRQVSGKSYVRV